MIAGQASRSVRYQRGVGGGSQLGGTEPRLTGTKWLVELGIGCVVFACLQLHLEFCAIPIQAGHGVVGQQIERALPLEIGEQVETETQVVRPPGLVDRLDMEIIGIGYLRRREPDVDSFEVAGVEETHQVLVNRIQIDQISRLGSHLS